MAKVKRKKLKVKRLFLLLVIIISFIYIVYSIFTMPIKHIYIKNTSLLTDNEIIETASIKKYPSIFRLNLSNIEKKLKKLELVSDVNITRKLNGTLEIDIKEAIPLFYNRNTNKVVLSTKKEVSNKPIYMGIPTLINYVPEDLLKKFIDAFCEVETDIIKMINEIEYNPNISNDITIDEDRFLLRMNDTNIAYINIINIERLNNYKDFFAYIGDTRGTLYLDSYDSRNDLLGLFTPFGEETNPPKDEDKKPEGEQNGTQN